MKNIVIRKADIEDINDILDLYRKTIWETEIKIDNNLKENFGNSDELKEIIKNDIHDENTYLLVAQLDSEIIGYISASILLLEDAYVEKVANIHEIAIKNEYQNQGIGKLLLDECEKVLKSKNVRYIKLTAFKENNNAIKFYENNGFEEYSVNYRKKI